MKKRRILIVLAAMLALSLILAACQHTHDYQNGVCTTCGEKDPDYTVSADGLSEDIPAKADSPTLMLHYSRDNSDYKNWDFWVWKDGSDGMGFSIDYKDDFGAVALVQLSVLDASVTDTVGIIPRKGGNNWTSKDVSIDRFLDLSTMTLDKNNYFHIYLIEGDGELYKSAEEISLKVTASFDSSGTKIMVETKLAIESVTFFADGVQIGEVEGSGSATEAELAFTDSLKLDLNKTYTVSVKLADVDEPVEATADISVLYDTDLFAEAYTYDGDDLGANYSATHTLFKVWSPVSTKIVLNIYNAGNGNETPQTYDMIKTVKGVFETDVSGNLGGKYYTYTVFNSMYPDGEEVVDPYAKSAGLNGERGQIVNFDETDPEGWDDVSPVAYDRKELVVWETHVADVTSSDTWNGTASLQKTFLGMIEKGTTYTSGTTTVTTGFDHIVELGVNAVQLLPIFDQANDESDMSFNWGYNPLNYNVLEGGYSTDPTNGYTRIKEFKQLVQVFNGEGINIIMDVVYNHVNSASSSNFEVLMPGYYFRTDSTGAYTNGSGCGNETASERPMYRKFMIDSVCFWAEEYKLGGFRFDLMGLHDVETMNQLVKALKQINPDIVVYGEPWQGGTSGMSTSVTAATQSNGNKFEGYGQFNDQMRDALIKSGMKGVSELGWVTNASSVSKSDLNSIVNGLKGITNSFITDPDKTVNYVTCHDNYTLYDRIKAAGITDEATVKKMAMLANSVVFSSNGTVFMLAGEEFLRTKNVAYTPTDSSYKNEYVHNSYKASYEVNALDYSLKVKNYDMFTNYKLLVGFKKTCGGLHFSKDEIAENYKVTQLADGGIIRIDITDTENNSDWIVIHANGTVSGQNVDVSGYTLYLDTLGEYIPLDTASTETELTVSAYQTLILYKQN